MTTYTFSKSRAPLAIFQVEPPLQGNTTTPPSPDLKVDGIFQNALRSNPSIDKPLASSSSKKDQRVQITPSNQLNIISPSANQPSPKAHKKRNKSKKRVDATGRDRNIQIISEQSLNITPSSAKKPGLAVSSRPNLTIADVQVQKASLEGKFLTPHLHLSKSDGTEDYSVLIVPAWLLPEHLLSALSQQSPETEQLGKLDLKGRIKFMSEKCKCAAFEVITIHPLRIYKMSRMIFTKKYETASLLELLEKHYQLSSTRKTAKSSKETTEVKYKPSSQNYRMGNEPVSENQQLARRYLVSIFESFSESQSKILNQFGEKICASTPLLQIGGVLSQIIIDQLPIQTEEKNKLSTLAYQHWEEVHWRILISINCSQTIPQLDFNESFGSVIQLLKSWPKTVKETISQPNEEMLSAFTEIQRPLASLLAKAKNFTSHEGKVEFCNQLHKLLTQTVADTFSIQISTSDSKQFTKNDFISRAQFMDRYLQILAVSGSLRNPQVVLEQSNSLIMALKNQDWRTAFDMMNVISSTIFLDNTAKTIDFKTIGKSSSAVCIPKLANFGFRDRFFAFRLVELYGAFIDDFKKNILQGAIVQVISETAFEEMYDSYKTLLLSHWDKEIAAIPLDAWAAQLHGIGYSDLSHALEELKKSCESLKEFQKALVTDALKLIPSIIKKIRQKGYTVIPEDYFSAADIVMPLSEQWGKELSKLNQSISKVQFLCLLMIVQPNLPPFKVSDLQDQFNQWNETLNELIQPTASFFYGFVELISRTPDRESEEIFTKSAKESHFTQRLFQNEAGYFQKLSWQVNQIRRKSTNTDAAIEWEALEEPAPNQRHPETFMQLSENDSSLADLPPLLDHEENSTSPIAPSDISLLVKEDNIEKSPAIVQHKEEKKPARVSRLPPAALPSTPKPSVESIEDKVESVFQSSTKSRKIVKNLKQLLNEYQLAFHSRWGKGDHLKLYINGVPIIFPEHKEWKPGTLKSIQKDVVLQLQEAIKSQKKQGN